MSYRIYDLEETYNLANDLYIQGYINTDIWNLKQAIYSDEFEIYEYDENITAGTVNLIESVFKSLICISLR